MITKPIYKRWKKTWNIILDLSVIYRLCKSYMKKSMFKQKSSFLKTFSQKTNMDSEKNTAHNIVFSQ